MDGILLIDKPKGWTSFDVLARVRGIIKTELRKTNPTLKNLKVGHTGTLDPAATGLLVLCIGKYTKKVDEMIRHDKTYEVELTLGAQSSTGDQEGEITRSSNTRVVSDEELQKVLNTFVGEQMQTPPAFSAIKIDGKRAYDLARAGKEVKLEPRKVTIHSLELNTYSFPLVTFTCSVSSGTYVRSLASDIGEKLGTGAYMSELRRVNVDRYSLRGALTMENIDFAAIQKALIL